MSLLFVHCMELSALKPWLVTPAHVSDCTVTVCGSHVKRVLTWSDCRDLDADFFRAFFGHGEMLGVKCTSDASWMRPPSSWTDARGANTLYDTGRHVRALDRRVVHVVLTVWALEQAKMLINFTNEQLFTDTLQLLEGLGAVHIMILADINITPHLSLAVN